MTLQEIYSTYKIPPNLVRHQLQVAAVGKYVCDHWIGPELDKDLILKTLLLHDLGNIVKFKRPFLGELEPQAAYWEEVQADFVSRYGNDANDATELILNELGLLDVLAVLVEMKDVWEHPRGNLSWEARICEYADCCVTPVGIEGFEMRMADLERRYGHGKETIVQIAMRESAKKVQENVDTDLSTLSKIDFEKEMEELQTIRF